MGLLMNAPGFYIPHQFFEEIIFYFLMCESQDSGAFVKMILSEFLCPNEVECQTKSPPFLFTEKVCIPTPRYIDNPKVSFGPKSFASIRVFVATSLQFF